SSSEYPDALIRAALCRAQLKLNRSRKKNSTRLLCLTAHLALNSPSLPAPILFNGLKQSHKYRETILNGLWNYQSLNIKSEQAFNQWSSSCAVCCLFNANKFQNESISRMRNLLMLDKLNNKSNVSNDLLKCSTCYVSVHRECYEIVCLALNVPIKIEYKQ
ncbi:unnamed protein product, partial [Rotaria magnacalcarata]